MVKVLVKGVNLWAVGGISPIPVFQLTSDLQNTFTTAFICLDNNHQYICGYTRQERRSCTCDGWRRTGKLCLHLHALATLNLCGTASRAEEEVSQVANKMLPHMEALRPTPTVDDDDAIIHDGLESLLNTTHPDPEVETHQPSPHTSQSGRWEAVGMEYGTREMPSTDNQRDTNPPTGGPLPQTSTTEADTSSTDLPASSSSHVPPSRRQQKLSRGIRHTRQPGKFPGQPSAPFVPSETPHTGRPPGLTKLHPYRKSSGPKSSLEDVELTYTSQHHRRTQQVSPSNLKTFLDHRNRLESKTVVMTALLCLYSRFCYAAQDGSKCSKPLLGLGMGRSNRTPCVVL
jgi:hypothetical protein